MVYGFRHSGKNNFRDSENQLLSENRGRAEMLCFLTVETQLFSEIHSE
jgi:hypothetical protein